jgi:truncated hemoglobin YjbI/ankyrin repeat protein
MTAQTPADSLTQSHPLGVSAGLAHRAFLHEPAAFRPFAGTDLFARIGGQPTVDALIDGLYDQIDADEALRPLFGRELVQERARQKLFFAEWLGGPRRYSDIAHSTLKHRHDGLPITRALAGRWLGHFRRALEAAVADERDRESIFDPARRLGLGFVNEQVVAPSRRNLKRDQDTAFQAVAWCGVDARALARMASLAHRGDVGGITVALDASPDAVRSTYGARLMQAAVLAGRLPVVELLLQRGVDADKPHYLDIGLVGAAFERVLFVTPLCAARLKRRTAVEDCLMQAGAKEDLFTAAFIGDKQRLASALAIDPGMSVATDPAVDVLDVTPIHHAVAGRQIDSLRELLRGCSEPLPGGGRALRGAAANDGLAMVEMLLARGVDATRIGVGRWVLHPEMSRMLVAHGGHIAADGAWIGHCCTGNQGRRDDPAYVLALLQHGAGANDWRVQSGVSATALHYAAKAGFVKTIAVLRQHGTDPHARDSRGRRPLDWLQEAAKSVDRERVRQALA